LEVTVETQNKRQENEAGLLGVKKKDGVLGTNDESAISDPALFVVEINDEDYRSFCWPCYALDWDSDCEKDL
jgi:hypothetical protein